MSEGKDTADKIALKLCEEIQAENKQKWFSIWRLQCFFCYRFAWGDVAKMCISAEPGLPPGE